MPTILIVDDRAINREALSLLLNEHEYEVLEAEDGLQATDLVQNNKPDLIITDILMPKMDGITFIKGLKENLSFAKIPVIFYTATYNAAEAHRLANASNINYVLTKPCDPEIILGTIESALKHDPLLFKNKIQTLKDHSPFLDPIKKEKLEKINLRLTNLIELSLDMSSAQDLEKLIYIMCKGGRQFLNSCYSGIILKDQNHISSCQNVVISSNNTINSYHFKGDELSESLKEIFLSEKAICLHSPIVKMDQIGLHDISLPFSSLLSLPLKTNRTFYGKIYFINKFSNKFFTPSDQRFMMTLADKFAINYENLLLYRQVERHTEQLELEIAQRNQTEAHLQEVTERLNLSLEAAKVGTWSWSLPNNELIWDKYASLLFGMIPQEFVGKLETFIERIIPEDQDKVQQELLTFIKHDLNQPIKFRIYWPDGSLHHLMLRGKVDYEEGKPMRMLGVCWDITEQIQIEEKLSIYRERMAEVARSSSLGEMASSLAHEINQPLAAITAYIKGCINRIEHKKTLTPEIIEILHETALQAERAGEVIHRIKNFLHKGELFYETVDINRIIEEALHMMQSEFQRYDIQIIHMPKETLPHIRVDKIQLQQVILNLARNAMEALLESNTIAPQITIESNWDGLSRVLVKILDNGPGFSEETAEHLFDLYFTTKSQGMGLGLAICHSIIEAHSGQLSAETLAAGGACFQFDLPIQSPF